MGDWITNPEELDYDWDQVIEWEGALKSGDISSGYVPSYGSGLTIGHGIDISRQTMADLGENGAGLSKEALAQLSDYMATGPGEYGPTHQKGKSGLLTKGNPLYIYDKDKKRKVKLGDADLKKLNNYYREHTVAKAEGSYNRIRKSKNANNPPKWEDLTSRQRTIMIDITHNAGDSFIEDSTKILLNAVATGDWNAVSEELRYGQWAEKDKPRHEKRANYLDEEDYK